ARVSLPERSCGAYPAGCRWWGRSRATSRPAPSARLRSRDSPPRPDLPIRPVRVLASPPTPTEEARMADTELAEELLQIEEADAWFEDLEATRGQTETRYGEVEPWAWARLAQRRRAVRAGRARLRPAAA